MGSYVILVHDRDEDGWERKSEAEKAATYARDEEFAARLAERGHRITGGSELTHSRETRVVRRKQKPTLGPFAETVEQLTGFYLVDSEDLDDLLEITQILARDGDPVVVRPVAG